MLEFAHGARRDAVHTGLGIEQEGLDVADAAVEVGLLALVFEVGDRAHAAQDARGAHAMGELDGETGVGDYLDAGVIGIEALDGLTALLDAESGLLALIDAHTDDDAVEEGQGARHHRVVADGEGVECACE